MPRPSQRNINPQSPAMDSQNLPIRHGLSTMTYGGGPFVLAPDPTLKDQPGDETHRAYPNVSDPRYIVFFLDVLFSENKSPC